MNKKFIPGVVVAVVAIGFAVVVAATNVSNNKAADGDVKGASTSQSEDKSKAKSSDESTKAADTAANNDSSTSDSSAAANTDNGVPADARSVLSLVSKPTTSSTVATAVTPAPTPVAPTPGPTPAPAPTPTPIPTPIPTPTPTPEPTTNLVANADVEAVNGDQPADWIFGGYNTTATSTYDTTGYNGSAHSLKVDVTAMTATPGDAKWISKEFAVTAGTTYQVSDYYKSVGTSQVDIMYRGAGLPDLYNWIGDAAPSADWAQFSSQFTVPSGYTSAVVFHALTSVGTLSTDNYSVVAGASTTPTPTPTPDPANGFSGGRVSLTFDDGLLSIYQNGMPLLKKYGFVSTQYLLSAPLTATDNSDYPEYMTQAQAKELIAAVPGTEVGSHTVHHCDLTGGQTDDPTNCPLGNTSNNAYELTQSKADLESIFGVPVVNFAAPYGASNANSMAQIKAAGYTSDRNTDDVTNGGFNSFGQVDNFNILVKNVEVTTYPATILAWVNQAKTTNTWLVLVFHGVDTSGDQYSITPTNLDAVLAGIQASGVKVETVAQALAESK